MPRNYKHLESRASYLWPMKMIAKLGFICSMLLMLNACGKKTYLGVGFYNVENLFDTIDDPVTIDEQFLPEAQYAWNTEKYVNKINRLSEVISTMVDGRHPAFLGLCEVENKQVITDLIASSSLKNKPYAVVHEQSIDPRGIDVAAIYDSSVFSYVSHGTARIDLSTMEDVTRDILWVRLKPKEGSDLVFIVNHWPSRRAGQAETEPKRLAAARTLANLCGEILQKDNEAQIVIMGDFNDMPDNVSLLETLQAKPDLPTSNAQLFNATYALSVAGKGSYCYRGDWNMLDQIIVNGSLTDGKDWDLVSQSATIVNRHELQQHSEKYEGYPLRTFGGPIYLNGYSDHFAVFVKLQFKGR